MEELALLSCICLFGDSAPPSDFDPGAAAG